MCESTRMRDSPIEGRTYHLNAENFVDSQSFLSSPPRPRLSMQHGHNPTFSQISEICICSHAKANLGRSPSLHEARGVEVEGVARWIEGGIGEASSLRIPGVRLSDMDNPKMTDHTWGHALLCRTQRRNVYRTRETLGGWGPEEGKYAEALRYLRLTKQEGPQPNAVQGC